MKSHSRSFFESRISQFRNTNDCLDLFNSYQCNELTTSGHSPGKFIRQSVHSRGRLSGSLKKTEVQLFFIREEDENVKIPDMQSSQDLDSTYGAIEKSPDQQGKESILALSKDVFNSKD